MHKLLVIDDDESVRKLLRFRLKNSYEIIDTGSPEEALALALQENPDAVLLDLMMPKYSGFEVCQTLSSLSFTQHIPIIIVSGESTASYKDFCEALGAKDFVQKPVDFEVLERKLSKVMEGSGNGQQSEPRVRLRVTLKLRVGRCRRHSLRGSHGDRSRQRHGLRLRVSVSNKRRGNGRGLPRAKHAAACRKSSSSADRLARNARSARGF